VHTSPTTRTTFRATLRRKLAHNFLAALVLAVVCMGVLANTGPSVAVESALPPAPNSPAALLAACNGWSGPAPRGAVAKRVVATVVVDGEWVPRYLGGKWVQAALDEALFGKDDPRILTVHGFCS